MQIDGIRSEAVHAFRDEEGFSRLTFDGDAPALLGVCFEHDLQTRDDTDLLYEQLEAIEGGAEPGFVFSGNSFTVTLSPDGVTIENDILRNEEPFEMSVEQYRAILDVWAAYLAR